MVHTGLLWVRVPKDCVLVRCWQCSLLCMALSSARLDCILQPLGTRTQRSCPGFLWALSVLLYDAFSSAIVPKNGSFSLREQESAFRSCILAFGCAYPNRTPLFRMDAPSSMYRVPSIMFTDRILQPLSTRTRILRLCLCKDSLPPSINPP
jgi:hypothetical protein